VLGLSHALLWLVWTIWTRHPARNKLFLFMGCLHVAMLMEIQDFPPRWGLLDAHSLWHAATVGGAAAVPACLASSRHRIRPRIRAAPPLGAGASGAGTRTRCPCLPPLRPSLPCALREQAGRRRAHPGWPVLSWAPLPQVGLVYLWYNFLLGDMRQAQRSGMLEGAPRQPAQAAHEPPLWSDGGAAICA
jgi:hypothetical protein